ncbi:hypothetical protein APHAL10511_003531 [Amanita phalloides]|nr:hypothetical protein APHAL10511_003531 [Amanita phalloides]
MSTSQVLRKPYDGLQRKLIIAFDIGTTFSGVSYALLIPGEPPVIQGVTQFPGQQKVGGDSKIPSVLDIRSGSIKIHGTQVGEFFEPAVKSIIKTIEEQLSNTSKPIKAIFMVGGFATSTYLFSKLDDHFKPEGIDILRPDAYLNKAVAEGAVLFKLDRSVSTRIARYTYGTESCIRFDPSDTDHYLREHKSFESLSGDRLLPDWFSAILCKGTQVSEETEFRCTYTSRYTPSTFRALKFESVIIKCYRARNGAFPTWIDLEPEFFPDLCTVAADLSKLKKSIKPQTNYKTGAKYFPVEFDVVLLFGLTELKAQIAWMQNGVEKRGPASIVYDTASMADP